MSHHDLVFDPFKSYSQAVGLWLETARTLQTQWVQTVSSMATSMPKAVDWKSVEYPVIKLAGLPKEDQMREMFQVAADINLNTWTHAANYLSALPRWMHWPTELPGRLAADLFHQSRSASHTAYAAANDDSGTSGTKTDVAVASTRLAAPLGEADDLTAIKGIGPKLSARLNELGIFHFTQIACWTSDEIHEIDEEISGNGRIERDKWVKQAKKLANANAA